MSNNDERPLGPKIDLVRHLALYTAFHRTLGNRVAHGICTPVVLVSGQFLMAWVGFPSQGPSAGLLHLGTAVSIALCAVLASIDLLGAALMAGALLPASAIAGTLVARGPLAVVLPAAATVHLLAWYGTVVIGHLRLEGTLPVGGHRDDTNLYFRRGYYLGRGLGAATGRLDPLVQFCIAPLAVVQDVLAGLGFRRELQGAVASERGRVLERIAQGVPPLSA